MVCWALTASTNKTTVLLIFCFYFFSVSFASTTPPFIQTPTGRYVSLDIFKRWHATIDHHTVPQRIFELSTNRMLSSSTGMDIDLSTITNHHVHTISPSNETVIVIDGETVNNNKMMSNLNIYEYDGYTVAMNDNDEIHFITSEHLYLVPVDNDLHPGLFFNVHSSSMNEHNDEVHEMIKQKQEHENDDEDNDDDDDVMTTLTFDSKSSSSRNNDDDSPTIATSTVTQTTSKASVPTASLQWQGDCSRWRPKRILQIAVSTDFQFCSLHSGRSDVTLSRIRYLMFRAEQPYISSSCLRFGLTFLEVYCKSSTLDPYNEINSKTSGSAKLTSFRKIWRSSQYQQRNIERDVALLLSGGKQQGSTTGTAFIAATCTSNSYAWILGSRSEDFVIKTIAHELGHNMGLLHFSYGIMTQGGKAKVFAKKSANALLAFLRSENANCITHANKPKNYPPVIKSCSTSSVYPVDCTPAIDKSTTTGDVFVNVAKIGWLKVGNELRRIEFAVRVRHGSVEIRLKAPSSSLSDTTESNEMSYTIALASFGNNAPSVMSTSYVRTQTHYLSFRESQLGRLPNLLSCCKLPLSVNIQTLLEARKNGQLIATANVIANVMVRLKCKYCNTKTKYNPMSNILKCPVCQSPKTANWKNNNGGGAKKGSDEDNEDEEKDR